MLDQVQLKQRIVGGVVLLALAVIIVPLLMDDPRQEVKILESNVEPWPDDPPLNLIEISDEEFSPIVEPIAQQPQSAVPAQPVAKSPQRVQPQSTQPKKVVANKVTEPPKVVKSVPKPQPKQKATSGKRWEVQVVSYSHKSRKRANRFLKRMREKGFQVELKETKRQLRLVTAPLTSEKAAREMKKKIDRAFKVDKVSSMVRLLK